MNFATLTSQRSPRSGRPGQLPTSAPHRSVHAQLRHTALQARNSPMALRPQPSHTIRRRHVEMGSRLGVPGISPSGGLLARRLLPSTGSRGSVPPLPWYYSTLRIPTTRPAALRCLRTGGIPVASAFRSHGRRMRRPWAWSWSPGTSRRDLPRRWKGLPGSWGTSVNVPCSPTPAGPRRQAIAAPRRGLPSLSQRRLPRIDAFGAQSHGPLTGCLRFAARVAPAPRKTRSRPLASSAGRG